MAFPFRMQWRFGCLLSCSHISCKGANSTGSHWAVLWHHPLLFETVQHPCGQQGPHGCLGSPWTLDIVLLWAILYTSCSSVPSWPLTNLVVAWCLGWLALSWILDIHSLGSLVLCWFLGALLVIWQDCFSRCCFYIWPHPPSVIFTCQPCSVISE